MAGHVELRHHPNPALCRISNDLARLFLGVEEPIRPHLMQLGKFFALDSKSLVFGQVPVKDIELDRRHGVKIPFEHFHGLVVTRYVNQETTPLKAWLILNLYGRQIEAISITVDELQKGFEAPQRADDSHRSELRLPIGNNQLITLIF